jgi:putative membrane protein
MSAPESKQSASRERSLAKGLAAGLVAGLVGVVAKTLAERMFPPRAQPEAQPAGTSLAKRTGSTAHTPGDSIPWQFGALTGATYGALAEYYPAATAKEGAAFGMALETLTHEAPLPALGISLPVGSETTRARASELTSHVVFGLTVEFVRRTLRRIL